jgi:hypothetical protein
MVGLASTVVGGLQFCWRNVSAGLVEPSMVERIDPFGGRVLDLINRPPWPPMFDHLGLVQAVDRLGERIVERTPYAANGSRDASFGEPLGEPDRRVLTAGVGVKPDPA